MYRESEEERLVELNAEWEKKTRDDWARDRGFSDISEWENHRATRSMRRRGSWATEEDLM